jgi:type VI secretion system secreted protein VgrG
MAKYTHSERSLRITTPFEDDYLLINSFTATEGISELFSLEVELLHEESGTWPDCDWIDPKKILGKSVGIIVSQGAEGGRYFNGIVSRFTQGVRSRRTSQYWITVVPAVWGFTQRFQSRIFQQKTVRSIIEEVFKGFEAGIKFELEYDYKPRNYCVQYRESDFDFVSRLMEEEGIYYFFEHTDDGAHKMIICDAPRFKLDCPGKSELKFLHTNTAGVFESYISQWETDYRLGPGKISFRDHNIQQPGKNLAKIESTKFEVGGNMEWEVYDFPGGYARKFDGIKPQGVPGDELGNIDPDGQRTAENAMQVIDAQYMTGDGRSNCSSLTTGHRFKMKDHPIKALNGQYVLTSMTHTATQHPAYEEGETGQNVPDPYRNTFRALSHGRAEAVPFRPEQKTEKPLIHGSQTAIVVGTGDEEIFTDKYGRIKVQFFWDRQGQSDGLDSCWVPVAQAWAGNTWGSMFIPRVGMEVLVHFLEGNPDQPMVTGCVYNPGNMPPYTLPDEKTKSTIKTNSTKGGGGFNELRFEDKKGSEHIFMHAEKDQHIRVKSTRREFIGADRHLTVGRDKREKITRDSDIIIEGEKKELIKKDSALTINGAVHSIVDGEVNSTVGGAYTETVTGSYAVDAGSSYYVNAAQTIVLEATSGITLKVGGSFITLTSAGIFIQGTMVMINSGGAALPGMPGPQNLILEPEEAELPINADPGDKSPTYKQQRGNIPAWKLPKYKKPQFKPKKPEDNKVLHWIEIQLNDDEGNPVPYEGYQIEMPDGSLATGSLDGKGFARVGGIDPGGNCKVTFPKLDKTLWKKA